MGFGFATDRDLVELIELSLEVFVELRGCSALLTNYLCLENAIHLNVITGALEEREVNER